MKKAYWWLLGGLVAIAAGLGAAIAVVNPLGSDDRDLGGRGDRPVAQLPSATPAAAPSPTPPAPVPSAPAVPAPTPAPEKLSVNSQVTIAALGAVRVGMTVDEASQAAGFPMVSLGGEASPGCRFYQPVGGPAGVAFMVTEERIARVDIGENSPIRTRSGFGIGSTRAQLEARFPGQIQVRPHEYTDGQYVIFVPRDAADQNYRIVFETDRQGTVLRYRAGKLSEVLWIEGCA